MRPTTLTLALTLIAAPAAAQDARPDMSWDSSGACSARSLASGEACHLNPAAAATAAQAGWPVTTVVLPASPLSPGFARPAHGVIYHFTFLTELTDFYAVNEFGWLHVNSATEGVIFPASARPGATADVLVPEGAIFYFRNTLTRQFFTTLTQPRQFSVWTDGHVSFLGVEDLESFTVTPAWCLGCSDYDHNDLLVSLVKVAKPDEEPKK